MTIRVGRLRRDRGVSVARPTPLGNPFPLPEYTREESIAKYRVWFADAVARPGKARDQFEGVVSLVLLNDGATLLCWCRTIDETEPPCHADVIAEAIRAML